MYRWRFSFFLYGILSFACYICVVCLLVIFCFCVVSSIRVMSLDIPLLYFDSYGFTTATAATLKGTLSS